MAIVSIGDLSQSFMLRRHNLALKADLHNLAMEVATGRAADTARQTNGDLEPLSGIEASLSRLGAYGSATSEAGLFTQSMQTALSRIASMAEDFGPTLLLAANNAQSLEIANIGAAATQKFETAVSTLNTRVGDRTLFAGQATNGPALADAETILTALESAISGAVSAQDVVTAVSNWFDDPAGYLANAYLGGAPLVPLGIAAGETATISVTALDPGVRETLKGLAMAAMLDRGAFDGAPAARAALARAAGDQLVGSATDRANMAAGLGVVEAQIADAKVRNGAETTALQIAQSNILSVDPYETASKLQATQTQLETLYAITARLSRLSLMDFLR